MRQYDTNTRPARAIAALDARLCRRGPVMLADGGGGVIGDGGGRVFWVFKILPHRPSRPGFSEYAERRVKQTGPHMGWVLDKIGGAIARYLEKPSRGFEPFTPSEPTDLQDSLRPGDVLLVEGNSRIAGVIKYLTQSTWSHAALYVGPIPGHATIDGEPHVLIEAEVEVGVVSAPLSKYTRFHTRVCRPIGLAAEDCVQVCAYAIERIGFQYDLQNSIDLMRYLLPLPVPQRWRRRMIALGSGDPTRLICSTLIAQAFEVVRYPILPKVTLIESRKARRQVLEIRHSSLYAPRDFDISPYFAVVKPTIEHGFDYRRMHWADLPRRPDISEPAFSADAGAGGRSRRARRRRRQKRRAARAPSAA